MRCVVLTVGHEYANDRVMTRSVSVVITDDIDGSEGAKTVSFSFEGVPYEIDLGETNRAKLETAFAPFVAAGRKLRRGDRRASPRPAHSAERPAVRGWPRAAGL